MSAGQIITVRLVYSILAGCFIWFASLQFNDVDAPLWIAVYASAALSSLGLALGVRHHIITRITWVFIACLVLWLVTLIPNLEGAWWDGEVEREFGGLTIVLLSQLGEIFFYHRMSRL